MRTYVLKKKMNIKQIIIIYIKMKDKISICFFKSEYQTINIKNKKGILGNKNN